MRFTGMPSQLKGKKKDSSKRAITQNLNKWFCIWMTKGH